jgi:hypothetical protein
MGGSKKEKKEKKRKEKKRIIITYLVPPSNRNPSWLLQYLTLPAHIPRRGEGHANT